MAIFGGIVPGAVALVLGRANSTRFRTPPAWDLGR